MAPGLRLGPHFQVAEPRDARGMPVGVQVCLSHHWGLSSPRKRRKQGLKEGSMSVLTGKSPTMSPSAPLGGGRRDATVGADLGSSPRSRAGGSES